MISVKQEVEKILQENPFIEDLIIDELINLSSYARKIQPQLEVILEKPVSIGSIVMSLKRLTPQLKKRNTPNVNEFIEDIMVRSGLITVNYDNSETLVEHLKDVVQKYAQRKDVLVNFSRGSFETNVICNQAVFAEIESVLSEEKELGRFTNIGSITIKMIPGASDVNGVYYAIFRMISNRGISIVEVVSTFHELTILVRENELDKAFAALKSSLK